MDERKVVLGVDMAMDNNAMYDVLWDEENMRSYQWQTLTTSSAEYAANRNFTNYHHGTGYLADDYLRITRDLEDEYQVRYARALDKHLKDIVLNGAWDVSTEEELDIEDERGGALDEFLDGFKPQQNKPERSDE